MTDMVERTDAPKLIMGKFTKQQCSILCAAVVVIIVCLLCVANKQKIMETFVEKTVKTGTEADVSPSEGFSVEKSVDNLNAIQDNYLKK
jgi:hypothetical protein